MKSEKEVEKAFEQHDKQIVMFVMGGDGGKISDTDLSTFATLYRAYEFSQRSVIFVINQIKKKNSKPKKIRENIGMGAMRSYQSISFKIWTGRLTRHLKSK